MANTALAQLNLELARDVGLITQQVLATQGQVSEEQTWLLSESLADLLGTARQMAEVLDLDMAALLEASEPGEG